MKKIKILEIYIYLTITFIILIPFIMDKYLYLLDSTPDIGIYKGLDSFYGKIIPIYGGFSYFSLVSLLIPMEIFQKIIFFTILFLSGCSTYLLVKNVISSEIASLYAGILYMLNPYTYVRILAGHWHILLPYAIFPLLLKSFIDLLEKKEIKEMIKFIFLLSLVAINIHMLTIALVIMIVIFIFWFDKHRDIRISKVIILSTILFILLNSYWIVPVLTTKNTIIDNIGNKDFEAFAPKGEPFDIMFMYGFWREGYIYAKDFIPYWQLLSLFIIVLAIYGFISYYKDEKIGYLVKALGLIGIIGFILATGINGPFGDINHWLYDNTILKGFRDSHKFVAMIVLAYAILGGLGVNKIKSIYDDIGDKV